MNIKKNTSNDLSNYKRGSQVPTQNKVPPMPPVKTPAPTGSPNKNKK